MMFVNPSTAMIAKAKSKYGRRLTSKDYDALVHCRSVGDVVRYLKTETDYQRCLSKVGSDVHRGNLENILRKDSFNSFLSLCRYQRSGSPVTAYLLRRTEIDELVKFCTLLAIGRPKEYLFSAPLYFAEHTELPLDRLSSISSYDELIDMLGRHPFSGVLEQCRTFDGSIDIAGINDALQIFSIKELYDGIAHMKNKSERDTLTSLVNTLCDYQNYSRIMRMKRFYRMDNDTLRRHLLPFGKLSGRKLDRYLSDESYQGVRESLADSEVGRKAHQIDLDDEMAVKGRFIKCRHEMYFSTYPEVVLLAYYVVAETELKNIITVVEGVRYSMEPKSIAKMLILPE